MAAPHPDAPQAIEADEETRARVAGEDFCPYRGLDPYDEAHRTFFTGRDAESEIVAANLYATPLTVLYGPSGVGKTSILQAGVVPHLREMGESVIVLFREWQTPDFARRLNERVLGEARRKGTLPPEATADAPLDALLRSCAGALGVPLFLIFDQFEEYFLYHAAREGQEGFEAELARAVNGRGGAGRFLICLREEGLSKMDRFRTRIPHLLSNLVRLEPLDRTRAQEVVEAPLRIYNEIRRSMGLPGTSIEPGLTDEVLRDEVSFEQRGSGRVQKHAAGAEGRAVELPFLQLVLTRLWAAERRAGSDTLHLATLLSLGGAAGVVRDHVNAALLRPSLARVLAEAVGLRGRRRKPSGAPARPRLSLRDRLREHGVLAEAFGHLVTPSGTKIAHTVRDLADFTEVPEETVRRILGRLSANQNRILKEVSGGDGDGESRYELAHDALAPAVLDWRARFQRRRRMWRMVPLAGLGLLVVYGLYLQGALSRAGDAARSARSQTLARDALLTMREDPTRADALARAAFAEFPSPQALDALRRTRFENRLVATLTAAEGGHRRAVRALAFSRDGRYLASTGEDSVTVLWDAAGRRKLGQVAHGAMTYDVAFDPAGGRMVVARGDGAAGLWSVPGLASLGLLRGHGAAVSSAAFAPRGDTLYTVGEDARLLAWDLATGSRTAIAAGTGRHALRSVAVDGSGRRLALGNLEGVLTELEGRRVVSQESRGQNAILRARFSPNDSMMAAASRDYNAYVFAWHETAAHHLLRHANRVSDVAWSPDGTLLATASRDGTARLWDAATGEPLAVLTGHGGYVHSVAFTPDGARVVTGADDGSIRFWRVAPLPVAIAGRPSTTPTPICTARGTFHLTQRGPEMALAVPVGPRAGRTLHFSRLRTATVTPDGEWLVAENSRGILAGRLDGRLSHVTRVSYPGSHLAFVGNRWAVQVTESGAILVTDCEVCRTVPSTVPAGWTPLPHDTVVRRPSPRRAPSCEGPAAR